MFGAILALTMFAPARLLELPTMTRLILPPLMLALLAAPCAALAQSNGNAASFNAGYGSTAGAENAAAAMSTIRDANGNLLVVDGVIKTANGGSASYSSNSAGVGTNTAALNAQSASGAGRYSTGVGQANATAIGNQLNVITTGSYNTVVVNSSQTNNGAVSAGAVGNGGVSSGN
jgi:holdfast attachment protein HfaA